MRHLRIIFGILIPIITFAVWSLYPSRRTFIHQMNDEVLLHITALTTVDELVIIQENLKHESDILIDFSGSSFEADGQIETLDLSIDCGDGFSGDLHTTWWGLLINDYGFEKRTLNDGSIQFTVGKMS